MIKRHGLVLLVVGMMAYSLPFASSIVYKSVDSFGNVSFSDKPTDGAEQINLQQVQSYSEPTPFSPGKVPEPAPDPAPEKPAMTYKSIEVVQPENLTTIRNPQGAVSVILNLTPSLKKGDKVQLLVDGEPLGEPEATTVYALQSLTRGSHSLAAQIIGSTGHVLKTSDSVIVYMMQPRRGMSGSTGP